MTGHLYVYVDFQRGILGTSLKEVLMSDTSQIALIKKLYAAMGDVNSFKSLLADDAEWDITEGFPKGGVYRGLNKTVSDFFPFLAGRCRCRVSGGRRLFVGESRVTRVPEVPARPTVPCS